MFIKYIFLLPLCTELPLLDSLFFLFFVTWLGGARCVVVAGVRRGSGGLHGGGRRQRGGLVHADLGFELRNAPAAVDVLKLLDLHKV